MDTVKIRVRVSTDNVGSECEDELEFTREEWEAMTEEQREAEAKETMLNMMEWSWEVIQ